MFFPSFGVAPHKNFDFNFKLVASDYQKSGIGTKMMAELEGRVKEMGAAMVQLVSVNDEMHEHFYGKLGYGDATNLKLKSKFLVQME